MNILAVGAHYDDIELGCGGTLILHRQNNDRVWAVVVSDSGYSAPDGRIIRDPRTARKEGEKASAIMGVNLISLDYPTFHVPCDERLTAELTRIIEENAIDTVYSHFSGDIHRDHQHAARCTLMAARHVPRLLMYQSNWYDGPESFNPTLYTDISAVMEKKKKAVKAHASEINRTGTAWIDWLEHKHRLDGMKIGTRFAEAFVPVRYLLPKCP